MMMPYLFVAPSEKGGRGVFTSQEIEAGTVVEISPVIVFSSKERKAVESTKLFNYIFEWGKTRKLGGLGLGYVSMYNHDYTSNCDYEMDFDSNLIIIKSVKLIRIGEELCINYNADPDDATKVWFHK